MASSFTPPINIPPDDASTDDMSPDVTSPVIPDDDTSLVDLGAGERELVYGLSYRLGQPQDMLEMVAFTEWRTRVASIAKGTEQRLGFRFKLRL